ncbi:tripartite motif-containing protein 3-like [Branchiostoma floridae]|uniref:RING-type E3 ubiquitin transferase n=1 Tax=Branchiostoma floridae TaxID=7739 RepID=A0A9J7MQU5_BRAFL|nr:tripartite motif-containing protein 3-like [Branchiostoma floridae]
MEAGPSITDRHRILEDFLSCGICFEPFTKPKALPCQHSFCLRCLESQHKQWLQDCRRTSHRQQQPFRCSTCREPVSVPSTGVKGLPDNHLVANLCEEFSKKAQVGEQKDTCGFHPTESVILFCQQCEVPVCSACIGQAHSGHRVTGIKQAARKIRANIRSQLNNGRQKMETFSAFLKKIQDVQQRLTGNTTQTQQEINKAFEVQVQKLQEQRDGLLSTVEKSHHDNMTALTGQRNIVLTQLTELSRVCEDTDKLAEQEDTVSLTQGLKLAQELAKFENTQTPEICEIKHCHFEPKRSSALIELGHRSPYPWYPLNVTVDGEGNILVTDGNNLCVHVLDSEGNFKFKFGREGSDESQLKGPWGICVDGMGNIIVADYDKKPYSDYMYLERRRAPPDNGCVKMFDSRGRFLCNIVSGMKTPCGVAVSPGGDVVVTDIVDCSVSIWTQA